MAFQPALVVRFQLLQLDLANRFEFAMSSGGCHWLEPLVKQDLSWFAVGFDPDLLIESAQLVVLLLDPVAFAFQLEPHQLLDPAFAYPDRDYCLSDR